jgi:hypothetical protein
MFVGSGIQYSMRIRHTVIYDLLSVLYNIFFRPYYLTNVTKFLGEKGNLLGTKCVFGFSPTTFVSNISHPDKNWARYDKKCTYVFM